MECTPRVHATDFQDQRALAGNGVLATTLYGRVSIDLADPSDLANVTAGGFKEVLWYCSDVAPAHYGSNDQVFPTTFLVTEFDLIYYSLSVSAANPYLYDSCAEVAINDTVNGPRFWMWGTDSGPFASIVDLNQVGCPPPMFSYRGPPINPRVFVRSGMIPGTSPAAQVFTLGMYMRIMSGHQGDATEISIPSPYNMPPFMPTGSSLGTHLFSAHATAPYPGRQPYPVSRVFRSAQLSADLDNITDPLMFDARMWGGPWKVQASFMPDAQAVVESAARIEQCMRSSLVARYPLVDSDMGYAYEIETDRVVDGARIWAYSPNTEGYAKCEIIARYP